MLLKRNITEQSRSSQGSDGTTPTMRLTHVDIDTIREKLSMKDIYKRVFSLYLSRQKRSPRDEKETPA